MYRKKFRREVRFWTDKDQNDSFSDSSYLFPIQRILQNEVMIVRNEANSILDLGWFNEGYPLLVGSNSGTFFSSTIASRDDTVIDCLIKWVQLAPAVDHGPALNRPCLRAWTQLTYFPSCSYQFSLPSWLCCEQNVLFCPVSKTPMGCQ